MSQVQGPVVAIALILAAVFIPTVFIPGITGGLYQQFAVTMAVSVIISAFNALTLARPSAPCCFAREGGQGSLARFFRAFNQRFGKATRAMAASAALLIRAGDQPSLSCSSGWPAAGIGGRSCPRDLSREEDQGYLYGVVQLPRASSLQQTDVASRQIEDILQKTPGVEYVTSSVSASIS